MSDTTITAEERAQWRSLVMPFPDGRIGNQGKRMLRLLNALEQAEAQLAAALQVNTKSQAEATADMLNAMMAGITGQKETVHVQVGGYQCPYCNEISKTIEAATEHDAVCPKHPAVMRAEKAEASAKDNSEALTAAYMSGKYDGRKEAEANVARLTKERDWLANKLIYCPSEFTNCAVDCAECRKEAARRAVAAGEG